MAGNNSASTMAGVFHDVRMALGEMFGGGKLDAKQELMIGVLFGLLGALARADGVVSTEEAHYTNGLMDELKLSTRARQVAADAFERGSKRQLDLDAELLRFMRTFPRGSSEVDRIYESLLRLAAADANIRRGERAFLEKVTLGLGFAPDELDHRLKRIMH
ncbi:MAG TPA: TerB family tellurite resistance protein [Rudaea sp.]|nr:TerB family tellurite resistance protein [Rudaea sp.]